MFWIGSGNDKYMFNFKSKHDMYYFIIDKIQKYFLQPQNIIVGV